MTFLPLSHIAAAMIDMYGHIVCGFCIWFARPDALKGSLGETLREVRGASRGHVLEQRGVVGGVCCGCGGLAVPVFECEFCVRLCVFRVLTVSVCMSVCMTCVCACVCVCGGGGILGS